jgi:hypothetical protein
MDPIASSLLQGSSFPDGYVVYQGTATTSSASSFTYTSAPLGTATADRVIIVGVPARSALANSCTIAGISATRIYTYQPIGEGISIFVARVPTGTTGNISVVLNGSAAHVGIYVWAAYNIIDPFNPIATDQGYSTRPVDLSQNVVRGSIGVCPAYNNDNNGGFTYVGLTRNFNSYVSGGDFSCASETFTLNQTPRTMSALVGDLSPAYGTVSLVVLR